MGKENGVYLAAAGRQQGKNTALNGIFQKRTAAYAGTGSGTGTDKRGYTQREISAFIFS